jgi:hypothetical protein
MKSRRMRWAGHVERMGEMKNVYKISVGKPEGKRLLGGPRSKWEDNIKMKIAVFWVVAPCSLVEIYQRFRGPCCLHHQGDE